jgi:anti-sigma factor RsiW
MNCDEFETALPAHLASDGTPAERAAMETHARDCARCARRLEEERRLDDLIREAVGPAPAHANELRQRIRRDLVLDAKRPAVRPTRWRFSRWLPLAAAIAVGGWLGTSQLVMARDTTLYRAAVADHIRDMTVRANDGAWATEPAAIEELARTAIGTNEFAARLRSAGHPILRARICHLQGTAFAHLVVASDGGPVSMFVRRSGGPLRGPVLEVVNDVQVRGCAMEVFESAGFQAAALTVLVVSDSSRGELLDLVRTTLGHLS